MESTKANSKHQSTHKNNTKPEDASRPHQKYI
jgi:hypothetical protein